MTITTAIKDMLGMEARITTLHNLFMHGLKDIYHGEKQLVDALQKMEDTAQSAALKRMFAQHKAETEQQVVRLESVFAALDETPESETCEAIEGLIAETEEVLADSTPEMANESLLFSAQAVEHYEIARYTALINWAQQLSRPQVVKLLMQNLAEEIAAERKITAMQGGNPARAAEEAVGGVSLGKSRLDEIAHEQTARQAKHQAAANGKQKH